MTKNQAVLGLFVAAVLAGHAAYWFIGGEYTEHALTRNALVMVQLAVGLGATLWFARKTRGQG